MIIKKEEGMNVQAPGNNQNIPRISLILPYEFKMKKKPALFELLMKKARTAENELRSNFREEKVAPVINKLRKVIKTVKCPANGKNIAIFISPFAEKVYYFTPSHLERYKLPVLIKQ